MKDVQLAKLLKTAFEHGKNDLSENSFEEWLCDILLILGENK